MEKDHTTVLEVRKAEWILIGQAALVSIVALGLYLFGLGGINP